MAALTLHGFGSGIGKRPRRGWAGNGPGNIGNNRKRLLAWLKQLSTGVRKARARTRGTASATRNADLLRRAGYSERAIRALLESRFAGVR